MAQRYHSLKLFRLLIGDVSQTAFANMIGFDGSHISLIEAGYRNGSSRIRDSIRALLHPLASVEDVEALLGGEMSVADVHKLAEAYAKAKEWKPGECGRDVRGPVGPGGLSDGEQGTDAAGAPSVCAPAQPAGDCSSVQDDAGAGEQGRVRETA
jgi:hypothetical protein